MTLDASILIATRNRAELLERTLSSLRQQDSSSFSWEVIVVDNGSSDDTPQVLARLAKEWPEFPLVALREERPGKSMALNLGISQAKGKLLLFTDDDIVPVRRWVANLLGAAERATDFGIFCGPIIPDFPQKAPWWLSITPMTAAPYGRFTPMQVEEETLTAGLPFGGNFAVRSSVLKDTRFDAELGPKGALWLNGEDTDLLERLTSKGERVLFVPSAGVRHFVSEQQIGFKWIAKRTFTMGRQTRPYFVARIATVQDALIECARLWRDFGERVIKFEALSIAAECTGIIYEGWRGTGRSKQG